MAQTRVYVLVRRYNVNVTPYIVGVYADKKAVEDALAEWFDRLKVDVFGGRMEESGTTNIGHNSKNGDEVYYVSAPYHFPDGNG